VLKNRGSRLVVATAAVAYLVVPNGVLTLQGKPAYVDPERPSVYITEAPALDGLREKEGRPMTWLRLTNNCRWTIFLPAVRGAKTGDSFFYRVFKHEDIVTPVSPPVPVWSGPNRPAPVEHEVVVPRFAGRYWSDAPEAVPVAPGRHVDFRIEANEAAPGLIIIVPFSYEWERPHRSELEPMHFVSWSTELRGLKTVR
jgi:hypothetical protein